MFGSSFLQNPVGETNEFGATLPRLLSPKSLQTLLVLFPALFLVFGIAALVIKIDTVANAHATVRPAGNPVPVPVTTGGKVAAVHVSEGDRVEAGTLVVTFDTTEARIRRQGLLEQQAKALATLEQLTAKRLTLATLSDKQQERANLTVSTARSELREAQRSFDEGLAEAREVREQAFQDAQFARQKFESMKELQEKDLIAKATLQEVEFQMKKAELAYQAAQRREKAKAQSNNLAQLKLAQEQKGAEILGQEKNRLLGEIETELINAQKTLDQLNQDLQLTERTLAESEIRMPVSGAVSALLVHHAGEIVTAGTVLFSIVPENAEFLVELVIPNLEMKNLKLGAMVKYSFDAYPATEFGKASGKIVKIAPDSVTVEGRSVYRAWATITQTELKETNGRQATIRMGMTAQAEIVTDRKPLLSLPNYQ